MIRPAFALSAAVILSACSPPAAPPPQEPAPTPEQAAPATPPPAAGPPEAQASDDWRLVAKPGHAERFAALPDAFKQAVDRARGDGHSDDIDALGPLLQIDSALERPIPSPGAYRCRSIQMSGNSLSFIAYPYFRCEVELTPGGDLIARKLTGSQRFEGRVYPEAARTLAYLGTAAWGDDEKSYLPYGQSAERDQVGAFERIGENRYRLTILGGFADQVEVIELVR